MILGRQSSSANNGTDVSKPDDSSVEASLSVWIRSFIGLLILMILNPIVWAAATDTIPDKPIPPEFVVLKEFSANMAQSGFSKSAIKALNYAFLSEMLFSLVSIPLLCQCLLRIKDVNVKIIQYIIFIISFFIGPYAILTVDGIQRGVSLPNLEKWMPLNICLFCWGMMGGSFAAGFLLNKCIRLIGVGNKS